MTFTAKDSSNMDNAAKLMESARLDDEISNLREQAYALACQCATTLHATRVERAKELAAQRDTIIDDIDAMRRESNRLYSAVHGTI